MVNDVLAGRNLAAVRAFAAARSTRQLLGQIKAPTFLLQGRRDFAFDLEQALVPFARLTVPKRLYLGDFGHAPAPLPEGELEHVLPDARRWFDRYLKGLPNGIDNEPRVEVAPDPVDRPHLLVSIASGSQDAATHLSGAERDRLDGQVRPHAASQEGAARDLRRSDAPRLAGEPERMALTSSRSLSAVTPQGREIVVSSGGAGSGSARSRDRSSIRLISQLTNVPPRSRLTTDHRRNSTAQSPGNLLYLSGVPALGAARRGPGEDDPSGSRPSNLALREPSVSCRSGKRG